MDWLLVAWGRRQNGRHALEKRCIQQCSVQFCILFCAHRDMNHKKGDSKLIWNTNVPSGLDSQMDVSVG